MSDIEAKFRKAAELVQNLPNDGDSKPTQEQKLEFYSLYKQAMEGDVNTPRPGLLDFTGKAKWDAWKSQEGMSKEKAMTKYVELLKDYLGRSTDADAAKLLDQLNAA